MSKHRKTPVTFSREEVRQIRDLMDTPRARVACPLCTKTLMLVGPIASDNSLGRTFEVTCEYCRRSTIINDPPGTHRPKSTP
jgi:ribosomal protein S27E